MKAIAVTKLSERRTKVVCGNTVYYVNQTEPEKFIVDDGDDQRRVTATSAEDAVETYLSPPPAALSITVRASPPPGPQYAHHTRGNRVFITSYTTPGGYDVAETSATPLGAPYQWTRIPAALSASDAVDEYIRRNP